MSSSSRACILPCGVGMFLAGENCCATASAHTSPSLPRGSHIRLVSNTQSRDAGIPSASPCQDGKHRLARGARIDRIFNHWSRSLCRPDVLPSWNDGTAKQAILAFVKQTTTPGGPKFIEPANRIAAFDQDGTTWVEQPAYTQVMFAFDQLAAMAAKDQQLKETEPFKTVLSGDSAAIAKLEVPELLKVVTLTHSGMTVEAFQKSVRRLDQNSETPALSPPLHGSCVPADARTDAIPARQRLQDDHRHRRRPRFRAHVC